ncbi:MAG TPA: sugar ABC transporter substrate-binding protein [Chthonomonadaceae bacterium]|nr:sugar ABC transporter substrate-binding protein [Chthonomonadaceae bacterium]
MRKLIGMAAALLLGAAILAGCSGKGNETSGGGGAPASAGGGGKPTLTIAWAQWDPSNYLETLSKDFTKETGINVVVQQIPWPQYQEKIQTGVWTGKSDAYDIIVGDSQWLGRGATEGHYVDLTDWSKTNVNWDEIYPSAKQFYCEYDGKIYGVPCEADAIGFAYRKDLFENPQEQAAFKAKYKYDLAPPKTWDQLRDIAEFFTRPQQKLYGAAIFYAGGGAYDGITMGFDQVLWCYGGELRDPKTNVVEGVINSPTGVKALSFYTQELKKFTPPGSENYYFNECLEAFRNGQVAMAMDWYTFFPALADKTKNPLIDKTGFFVSPAGPGGHFISLGGQGMSISSYSKHQDEAKQFLAWFIKKETQQKWADLGGLTTTKPVLESADFKTKTPFNAQFADSVQYLRDFYNIPQYAELLEVTQIDWNACVAGTQTPQAAMDDVAKKHTEILKKAGLIK